MFSCQRLYVNEILSSPGSHGDTDLIEWTCGCMAEQPLERPLLCWFPCTAHYEAARIFSIDVSERIQHGDELPLMNDDDI